MVFPLSTINYECLYKRALDIGIKVRLCIGHQRWVNTIFPGLIPRNITLSIKKILQQYLSQHAETVHQTDNFVSLWWCHGP